MSNQFQVSFREEGADKGYRKNVEEVKVPVWEVCYFIWDKHQSELLKHEFFINKEDAEKRAECFRNYKQPMQGDRHWGEGSWEMDSTEHDSGRNILVRQLEAYSVVENDEEVFLGIPDEDILITLCGVEVA
jgi:hypothetical protein